GADDRLDDVGRGRGDLGGRPERHDLHQQPPFPLIRRSSSGVPHPAFLIRIRHPAFPIRAAPIAPTGSLSGSSLIRLARSRDARNGEAAGWARSPAGTAARSRPPPRAAPPPMMNAARTTAPPPHPAA